MSLSKTITALLQATVLVALSGCISTGDPLQVSFLSLPPGPAATTTTGSPRVIAGPFDLPEYLNRQQLVIRGDDGRVTIRETERWAEPLDRAVGAAVAGGLRRELASAAVVQFPVPSFDNYDVRVSGKISRFEATGSGEAVLEIVWAAFDKRGTTLSGPVYAAYSGTPESTDGAAIARQLGQLLDQLAADIATTLRELDSER